MPDRPTLVEATGDPLLTHALATGPAPQTSRASIMIDDSGTRDYSDPVGDDGPCTSKALTQEPAVTFTLQATVSLPGQDAPVTVQKQITVKVTAPM